ncbi:cell wall-binding repeat-containing protein [Candidatus Clostridium stratigraminis]|uniref:Cell wall-binding repeat-containing protein n=1 Tax=Candidatus Clostridium stratigraminis TaxID=3381661 RepID=A0ABW8T3H1_9CLOT
MRNAKRLIAAAIVSCMVFSPVLPVNKVFAADASQSTRLYGADRYHTAIAVARANWTSSDYAVITCGTNFPDALCAAPLAKAYDAPTILTAPKGLDPDVITLLKDLKVKNVFIVGGTGVVTVNVENQLKALSIKITRLSGSDRFGTSAAVAAALKSKLGTITNIAVAPGANFPDALSISSIAANLGMPILLTNKYSIPSQISSFVKANPIAQTYVVGGIGVITDSVKNTLPNAKRLGGVNRFGTNAAVLSEFKSILNYNTIYVANADGPKGNEFADALTGAPVAAKTASPVVLVYKALDASLADVINPSIMGNTKVVALGGSAVVPDSIVTQVVSKIAAPALKSVSLKNTAANVTINGVITEPAAAGGTGKIEFVIPAAVQKVDSGSAVLSQDLMNAALTSSKVNFMVNKIGKADNFGNIIFNAMTVAGYNPSDGVLTSNIKTILDGAQLTLTDNSGSVKKYTLVITIK